MSDPKASAAGVAGIPAGDAEFLLECLRNTTSGSITVDFAAVAEARGFNNPRSVANKVSALKKKYNLPFGNTKGNTPTKAGDAGESSKATVPKTPSKNRVVKSKATPGVKKGTRSSKKGGSTNMESMDEEVDDAVAGEDEDGESGDPIDEYQDVEERLVVEGDEDDS